jgi:hypothetical protein
MRFKTLTYLNQFVDTNLLNKGIYISEKPTIYPIDTTIESLVKSGKMMKDMAGNNFISDSYFENLNQCKLTEIEINFVD